MGAVSEVMNTSMYAQAFFIWAFVSRARAPALQMLILESSLPLLQMLALESSSLNEVLWETVENGSCLVHEACKERLLSPPLSLHQSMRKRLASHGGLLHQGPKRHVAPPSRELVGLSLDRFLWERVQKCSCFFHGRLTRQVLSFLLNILNIKVGWKWPVDQLLGERVEESGWMLQLCPKAYVASKS